MCGLLVKCALLVVMIHGFRALGRRAGPRYSALLLGLPSTTAAMLVLCGWDRGDTAATWMGEANLLGLVAAVALPLAYAQAVALGCRLAPALLGAVAGYFAVAVLLAALPVLGVAARLSLAATVILAASALGRRIADPPASRRRSTPSPSRAWVFRSVIPTLYVLAAAAAQTVAGPSRAGLVTTFPSMSLVVLAVTHLEAGPSEASRIARFLPFGNLSTLAFLAAFCWVCPAIGLGGGLVAGYVAAVLMLVLIEQGISRVRFPRGAALPVARPISALRPSGTAWGFATYPALSATRLYAHTRLAPGRLGRGRLHLAHRGGFSPWVETLGW
ncbi:MAG: hypothetical protein ACLQIB_04530 [Isosphaeraceae bacterium]